MSELEALRWCGAHEAIVNFTKGRILVDAGGVKGLGETFILATLAARKNLQEHFAAMDQYQHVDQD